MRKMRTASERFQTIAPSAAALLLLGSVAWAEPPTGAMPLLRGPAPQGPLKPFVIDMVGTLAPDAGPAPPPILFHDTLEDTIWHGHKATRRETATTMPGGQEFVRWAVVIFDAKTLLPYYSEYRRADGLFLRHEFDGLHVKETRSSADVAKAPRVAPGEKIDVVTSEFDLPQPGFTWLENTGLPILLALPLRDGFAGSVPVITGDSSKMQPCLVGPCHVLRMSYQVKGQEVITGISGKPVRTWKVWIPETRFTFWIACDEPRLEGVTWPGPGGTYSMTGRRST